MTGRALFWWRWLVVVTVGVLLSGLGMVLAPDLTRRSFGLLILSSADGITSLGGPAVAYITLIHGVLGAVMFGWSVMMLFMVLGPFRRASHEAWLTLAVSLAAWLIPDTAFSLWFGFSQNAVLNAVIAVLFSVPLAATYRVCCEERT